MSALKKGEKLRILVTLDETRSSSGPVSWISQRPVTQTGLSLAEDSNCVV